MNPFSYGTIVKGDNFYDRKEECTRIVNTLSGGNNLVLYAPRRFGKTSLVFKAIEQLEAKGFICIYFDFMPVFSPESFVRLYAKSLSAKQSNLKKFAQTFASVIKTIRPVLSFGADGKTAFSIDFAGSSIDETIISQLLDMPEKLTGTNKRVIVFFDEFQEVEKLDNIHFEGLLRSKIQQHQSVNYLFLGSKTHLLKELFNNKKRAFYNAASQMTIGPLPEKETIDYLQQRFAGSAILISVEMAKYIISAAANIPHYIQMMAAEIWQYMVNSHREITKEIVDDCAKRLSALKSDYYMELFDRQSQSKKQLLQALITNGKNPFSTAYIKEHRLPGAATLQRAVNGLITDGIVEKINDEYFIADPFFKLFLAIT
jgi:AAA+ ATPase superfamily predicted ATPase